MDLARLLDESPGLAVSAAVGDLASVDVTSVAYDSRAVAPGALFMCVRGLLVEDTTSLPKRSSGAPSR